MSKAVAPATPDQLAEIERLLEERGEVGLSTIKEFSAQVIAELKDPLEELRKNAIQPSEEYSQRFREVSRECDEKLRRANERKARRTLADTGDNK